ncbi:hypothetical protein SHIRM173S_06101 [Streptomyces hirsutus]
MDRRACDGTMPFEVEYEHGGRRAAVSAARSSSAFFVDEYRAGAAGIECAIRRVDRKFPAQAFR